MNLEGRSDAAARAGKGCLEGIPPAELAAAFRLRAAVDVDAGR